MLASNISTFSSSQDISEKSISSADPFVFFIFISHSFIDIRIMQYACSSHAGCKYLNVKMVIAHVYSRFQTDNETGGRDYLEPIMVFSSKNKIRPVGMNVCLYHLVCVRVKFKKLKILIKTINQT